MSEHSSEVDENADAGVTNREGSTVPEVSRPVSSVSSFGEIISSSEDESLISPPQKERSKRHTCVPDPRIDNLVRQVSYISGYMTQLPQYLANITGSTEPISSGMSTCQNNTNIKFGDINVNFNEKIIVNKANKERLQELTRLQQFDSPAWKGIRYKTTLRSSLAAPGFTQLKINEELCHLNRTKDYLASAEEVLAGLSNISLEQSHLLKVKLQELVDWATINPQELNASSLFEKITALFGPDSSIQRCFDTTMQILCGRRSECIEIRRNRILKEIKNENLKAALVGIPPSSEYLFSREGLQPLIQSLGGSQIWLNTPDYLKSNTKEHRYPINSYRRNTTLPTRRIKQERKSRAEYRKNNSFRNRNIKYRQNKYKSEQK